MEKCSSLCSYCPFARISNYPKLSTAMMIIGGLYLTKQAFSLLNWCAKYLIPFPNNLKKKYGDGWVIITGGSEGIGRSLAEQMIQQQFKVLLIARDQSKLESAVCDLKAKYPEAQVKTLSYDFNVDYNDSNMEELQQRIVEITGNDISILFNNVGVMARGNLIDLSNKTINDMININLVSVTFFTKIIGTIIADRNQKTLIVVSGSIAGRFRMQGRTIYASTKAYLEAFLECLQREYPQKIDCTYLEIGPVQTKMTAKFNLMSLVPSDSFAKSAVKYIGKYPFTTGHLSHELLTVMYWNVPFMKSYINKVFCPNEDKKEQLIENDNKNEEPQNN